MISICFLFNCLSTSSGLTKMRRNESIKQKRFDSMITRRSRSDDLDHFKRWLRYGTYSLSQRFQIEYAGARTYRFRWSISGRKCDGNVELAVPCRKWFGVRASRSVASGLTGVIERAFRPCFNKQNVVVKISSVKRRFPKTA